MANTYITPSFLPPLKSHGSSLDIFTDLESQTQRKTSRDYENNSLFHQESTRLFIR